MNPHNDLLRKVADEATPVHWAIVAGFFLGVWLVFWAITGGAV